MAKAFDDNERKLIKDKLKEGALLFIQQQGVRKTSVDELVKYANISKGAFYLFYTSKELLFFDTIIDYHKKLEKEFLNAVNKHTDNITVDTLTDIISDLLINNKPYFVSVPIVFSFRIVKNAALKAPANTFASINLLSGINFSSSFASMTSSSTCFESTS